MFPSVEDFFADEFEVRAIWGFTESQFFLDHPFILSFSLQCTGPVSNHFVARSGRTQSKPQLTYFSSHLLALKLAVTVQTLSPRHAFLHHNPCNRSAPLLTPAHPTDGYDRLGLERRGPASVQTETSNTINLTLSVPAPSGGDANDYEYSVVVTPKKIRPRGPQVDAAGPPIPAPSFGCPISHNCPTKATTQGGTNSYGRKAKAWYVITKGLAIGVFYEFWSVHPLALRLS